MVKYTKLWKEDNHVVEGSVRNINKGMEDGKHFNNFKGTCSRFDIKFLNFIFSFPMFIRINLYRSL